MNAKGLGKNDKELVKLLQNLIRIPSWIPDDPKLKSKQNENEVVDFLESWIDSNTQLDTERQSLKGGRFNLIAKKGKPDLVFLAHTDTVAPSSNAKYDQLAAEIHDDKIWGRGAADMKSGIAAMIQAISLIPNIDNIWLFLYADEEYDFLGMKALVKEYKHIKPKLIVSSDGSDLKIGHGCRGLIEFRSRVKGETGHPAMGTGKSSILEGFRAILKFEKELENYNHPKMGGTNLNIAYVMGGKEQKNSFKNNAGVDILDNVGQAGNVVPDIMEFKVEIRPGSPDLGYKDSTSLLKKLVKEDGLDFKVVEKIHDHGAWYTSQKDIQDYIEIAKTVVGSNKSILGNPGKSGYIDLQMLWDAVGRPPAFMFGGGAGETAHKPNEYIEIDSLIKTRNYFVNLLKKHS